MTTNNEKSKTELRHRFIEKRAKGLSIRSIAKELGLSPQTICNWQTELDDEIARRKAIELEALYEKHFLQKESRIKFFGDQIQALQKELKNRDLSDVSTDRLFDLLLKYLDEAVKDVVEPKFSDKNGTKLDSAGVSEELARLFTKYQHGDISDRQARQLVSLLMAALKAEEQVEIREKLDKLTSILDRSKK